MTTFEMSYGLTNIVLYYLLALAGVELVRRAYLKLTKYKNVKMPVEERKKKLSLEMYVIAFVVLIVAYLLFY
jgi:hypothetical protein